MCKPGVTFSGEDILAHCRVHLSDYKAPHTVYQVDAIPRTGSGKIIRFKLREQLAAGAKPDDGDDPRQTLTHRPGAEARLG